MPVSKNKTVLVVVVFCGSVLFCATLEQNDEDDNDDGKMMAYSLNKDTDNDRPNVTMERNTHNKK